MLESLRTSMICKALGEIQVSQAVTISLCLFSESAGENEGYFKVYVQDSIAL